MDDNHGDKKRRRQSKGKRNIKVNNPKSKLKKWNRERGPRVCKRFRKTNKYYCDYCDIHLTSNAMNVRKTHNDGKHHKENVKHHYKAVMQENAQKIINRTIQDAEATHMAPNILSHDVMFYPLMNVNNPFMISTPNFAPFINFPPPCYIPSNPSNAFANTHAYYNA